MDGYRTVVIVMTDSTDQLTESENKLRTNQIKIKSNPNIISFRS